MLCAGARVNEHLLPSPVNSVPLMDVPEHMHLQGHIPGAVVQIFAPNVYGEHSIDGSVTTEIWRSVCDEYIRVVWDQRPL